MEFFGAGETGCLAAELVLDRAFVRGGIFSGHGRFPIADKEIGCAPASMETGQISRSHSRIVDMAEGYFRI